MSDFEYGLTEEEDEEEEIRARTHMELYDWIQCIVTALVCGVLIFVFVGRTISVDGNSMFQTLRHNDRVIMSNLFYTPAGGDIVVFRAPSEQFEGVPLVKRVIATAGQSIDIDFTTGGVRVDGILLDEPYIYTMTTGSYNFEGPVTIPDGYVFVMGDNRASSTDSRSNLVGLVDTRYILGKVLIVLTPGADEFGVRDWTRFGVPS